MSVQHAKAYQSTAPTASQATKRHRVSQKHSKVQNFHDLFVQSIFGAQDEEQSESLSRNTCNIPFPLLLHNRSATAQ